MSIVNTISRKRVVRLTRYSCLVLFLSITLIGCSSSNNNNNTPEGSASDGVETQTNNGIAPENDRSEVLGDWDAGCIEVVDNNNVLIEHQYRLYSIDEDTWTHTIERYALDDTMCLNLLGSIVYEYQMEILTTATPATLDGSFFGNATNFDILNTEESVIGDASAEDFGSGFGIWLVKDDRLYSNVDFSGSRPTTLMGTYSYLRI